MSIEKATTTTQYKQQKLWYRVYLLNLEGGQTVGTIGSKRRNNMNDDVKQKQTANSKV